MEKYLVYLLFEGGCSKQTEFIPSTYNMTMVKQMINLCKTASVRARLGAIQDNQTKAAHTIIHMNYYPTRFDERYNLYDKTYPRTACLDLPFSAKQFDGLVFWDDL